MILQQRNHVGANPHHRGNVMIFKF